MNNKFNTINELLLFKEARIIFKFNILKDPNDYVLYYLMDLEDNSKKLQVSYIEQNGRKNYNYLKDIDIKDYDKVKKYIEDLINGEESSKEIKILKQDINLEPNVVETTTEKDRQIECINIDDLYYSINELEESYFNKFIKTKDLNSKLCQIIIERNNKIKETNDKENIKGNISIFFITLVSVIAISFLIFMFIKSLF